MSSSLLMTHNAVVDDCRRHLQRALDALDGSLLENQVVLLAIKSGLRELDRLDGVGLDWEQQLDLGTLTIEEQNRELESIGGTE